MQIIYLPQAEEDLAHWVKTGNKAILKKIAQLTRAILDLIWELASPRHLNTTLLQNGREQLQRSTDTFILSKMKNYMFTH